MSSEQRVIECTICNGTGERKSPLADDGFYTTTPCTSCNGTGVVGGGRVVEEQPTIECEDCDGSDDTCWTCHGTGRERLYLVRRSLIDAAIAALVKIVRQEDA